MDRGYFVFPHTRVRGGVQPIVEETVCDVDVYEQDVYVPSGEKLPTCWTLATWPITTRLRCVWCTLQHDRYPIPHITTVERINGSIRVTVGTYHYCSWSCYVAVATEKEWSVACHFANVFSPPCGRPPRDLQRRPPRHELDLYGGPITSKEFTPGYAY